MREDELQRERHPRGLLRELPQLDNAPVNSNPFPDSRPLRELIESEPTTYELPPDAPWRFIGVSSMVTWQRCDCPWWHRLPFVGRLVHSDLP